MVLCTYYCAREESEICLSLRDFYVFVLRHEHCLVEFLLFEDAFLFRMLVFFIYVFF